MTNERPSKSRKKEPGANWSESNATYVRVEKEKKEENVPEGSRGTDEGKSDKDAT